MPATLGEEMGRKQFWIIDSCNSGTFIGSKHLRQVSGSESG